MFGRLFMLVLLLQRMDKYLHRSLIMPFIHFQFENITENQWSSLHKSLSFKDDDDAKWGKKLTKRKVYSIWYRNDSHQSTKSNPRWIKSFWEATWVFQTFSLKYLLCQIIFTVSFNWFLLEAYMDAFYSMPLI